MYQHKNVQYSSPSHRSCSFSSPSLLIMKGCSASLGLSQWFDPWTMVVTACDSSSFTQASASSQTSKAKSNNILSCLVLKLQKLQQVTTHTFKAKLHASHWIASTAEWLAWQLRIAQGLGELWCFLHAAIVTLTVVVGPGFQDSFLYAAIVIITVVVGPGFQGSFLYAAIVTLTVVVGASFQDTVISFFCTLLLLLSLLSLVLVFRMLSLLSLVLMVVLFY